MRWSVLVVVLGLVGCGSREVKQAQAYLDVHEYARARELLSIELQADPKNVEAYLLLGRTCLLLGDQAGADAAFEKALLLRASTKADIGGIYAAVAQAVYSGEGGGGDRVGSYLAKAVSYDPGVGARVADWAITTAGNDARSRRTSAPVALLRAVVAVSPSSRSRVGGFLSSLAREYADRNFFREAASYAVAAGETDPDQLRAAALVLRTVGLGVVLPDEASLSRDCLERALQWNPEFARDEEVVWALRVRLGNDDGEGVAVYLSLFPSGRHRDEAEAFRHRAVGGREVPMRRGNRSSDAGGRPVPVLPVVGGWSGAVYQFNEGNGTVAQDTSGPADGVIVGAAFVPGHGGSGTALRFGDRGDKVTLPQGLFAHFGNTAYFAAWIRPASYHPGEGHAWTVFRKRAAYNDWGVYLWHDGRLGGEITGANREGLSVKATDDVVPLGSWTRVELWYDGTTLFLYRDGRLIATNQRHFALDWNRDYWTTEIGNNTRDGNTGYGFVGDIDEVIISPGKPN